MKIKICVFFYYPTIIFAVTFRLSSRPRGLDVNEILDKLDELELRHAELITIQPPEGADSDGYDESDTEAGEPAKLSRTLLTADVLEVRGPDDAILEIFGEETDSVEVQEQEESLEQPNPTPSAKRPRVDNADEVEELPDLSASPPMEKKARMPRENWEWNKKLSSFRSLKPPLFPLGNYTPYKDKSPRELIDLFLTDELLEQIAHNSNEYAMSTSGAAPNITAQDIRTYIAVLELSGYCSVTDVRFYWSNTEDTENKLVKSAISRDRFLTIKKFFHLPDQDKFAQVNKRDKKEGEVDRFRKVRYLVTHMQNKFSEHFVPEQAMSHDEAMIKYFGKSGLKQSIRNKPIRFGFKAWCLCTPKGYMAMFELYQGKAICPNSTENIKAVGAAGASVLDLLDLLPEVKKILPYHLHADNFFTSHKLVDVLIQENYHYTGTIRQVIIFFVFCFW